MCIRDRHLCGRETPAQEPCIPQKLKLLTFFPRSVAARPPFGAFFAFEPSQSRLTAVSYTHLHQFKQLHGNVLSCSHQNTFLLYHKTTRFDRETIQNCRRVRFGKYQRKNYFKFCISETTAVVSEMLFHGKGSYRETASLPKGAKKRRGGLLPSNPAGLPPPSVREALAKPEALHLSRKLCRCERLPL